MDKKLNIISTNFEGLFVIEPNIYKDKRGSFSRLFCENELQEILPEKKVKQINHSITDNSGTVRGLHFQYAPDLEVKIVRCLKGKVFDVVVDIRKNSKTFLEAFTIELSQDNNKMILIPEGFAHGFQSLEDESELIYFHSSIYNPENEGSLNALDPLLSISWPLAIKNISKKDKSVKYIDESFKGIEI